MGKVFCCLALACFVSAPAFAKEDRLACKADADCAVADSPCGQARPLNKKYLKENEEFNSKIQMVMQCPEKAEAEASSFTALCKEKKCVLEKKAEPKPPPAPAPKP